MRKDGGRDGRAKVALAARRLMSLAKEVEGVDGAEMVSPCASCNTCTDTMMASDKGYDRKVLRTIRKGHAEII